MPICDEAPVTGGRCFQMRLMSLGVFGAQWRRYVADSSSRRARLTATRWALIYAGAGSLWVLLSDQVVNMALDLQPLIARVQQLKGLSFVALTGVLVYLAVYRTARRMQAQHKLVQRQHADLLLSETRWRHLMHELEEVAWFSSVDGSRVYYVSDASMRLYGRPPQAFIDRPDLWKAVVHPEDLPQVEKGFEQMLRTGSKSAEYRVRHTDGRWRWVRDRASVLRDAQGQPIGIGGIAEDITERLREQSALRQRELQLADIVDTALDAIILVDAFQHVVVFNRAAERVFRIDAPSAIGCAVQRFIPQPLQAAHRAQLQRAQEAGLASSRAGLQRLQGLRADGEPFVIEASISRLDTERGPVMTVVLRDTAEMGEAEAARDAQATAEAASRAKTEFLSRMSHELRTPLNAVLGFSQLLQSGGEGPLTPGQRAQVDYIYQAGWHLLALINDVLDVSRIEAGEMQVQAEGVSLRPLVSEVLRMCEGMATRHQVTVESHLTEGLALEVLCDRTRLRQVLLNLLSNAIKYNLPGGRVDLWAVRDEGSIRLDIEDSGIGMTHEQLQHVFEPFNRLGRERTPVEGTGIGLTLTRELVHLMHGRIAIHSELDRGTRVQVHLPGLNGHGAEALPGAANAFADELSAQAVAPLHEALPASVPVQRTAIAQDVAAPEAPVPTRRLQGAPNALVLYIEDNPVNALVVQELLAPVADLRLETAEDGASGIRRVKALQPDLVLLDMRLPDMTGEEVLSALRADAATRDVRVVALSASAMPEDVNAARDAGALAYWTKPIDFGRFLTDVKALLGLPGDGDHTRCG